MSETKRLLSDIEDFLRRSSMLASTFGHAVVNDGKLVARLRRGGTVTLDTATAIRAYIARRSGGEEPERTKTTRVTGQKKAA